MEYPPKYHKYIRLRGNDYTRGAYFVTLCTDPRRELFGSIVGDGADATDRPECPGAHRGSGPSFFDGNLSTYFNDTWFIGGELSISWANAILMGGFGGGLSRPTKAPPLAYTEFVYTAESRTASSFGHALLGYSVWDRKHIRITPFLGFSGLGFSIDEDNGNVLFKGRQAGVDIDWKFSHWQELFDYQTAFANKFHQGYWAVRLRLGYEGLFNEKDNARFGGSQVFVRVGIAYFEGYGRRVKTWKHRSK